MKKNAENKTIGVIGGVGPQASEYLYRQIMRLAQVKYGAKENDDFPEVVLHSIPVPDFISDEERMGDATVMFEKVLKGFEKLGVSRIVIGSNTAHLLLDKLRSKTQIEFVSIIDAVTEKIESDGRKEAGLLASPMTIKYGLYEKPLKKLGVELVYPDRKGQRRVEEMMRAVMAGTNNGELKRGYVEVAQGLFDRGAEAIILGCTELPLAISYEALGDKVYDSMRMLAAKIVDYYYNKGEEKP